MLIAIGIALILFVSGSALVVWGSHSAPRASLCRDLVLAFRREPDRDVVRLGRILCYGACLGLELTVIFGILASSEAAVQKGTP